MFLVYKFKPNGDTSSIHGATEFIAKVKSGKDLDEMLMNMPECDLDVYDEEYYEYFNVNIDTGEII